MWDRDCGCIPVISGVSRVSGSPTVVTIGELVEAVAAVTVDPTEQAVVVDHILRTRAWRDLGEAEIVG